MTMDKCISRLFISLIMLSYTAAVDDDSYGRYADLCNQNLTALDQYSNELKAISPETMYISLCQNDMTSVHKNTFYKFTELEKIIMSGNNRLQFPADGSPMLTSPSLTDFVCEQCGIVKIFNHSVREMPSLEYLVLSSNSISQIEKHAFRKNQYLKELNIRMNLLRWIPSTILIGLHKIETLDLSFNRELAPVMDKPFLKSNALEILKCNSCGFTSIDGNTFVMLTNLKELHLKDNPVFQLQQPINLSRAIELLKILSTNKLRSPVDFQSSEEDLEINLEFDLDRNSEDDITISKAQSSESIILAIMYKH
ncbi:leucine-rich repeats and immunoglobulin-like domains protein 1 [Ochlerotatus camptorhynchus]|uniref:leucine-rich repeats and immunoglobulin-like domains protein 1 n=1 Tax=Ochlerotatus camptorhynchus TaxID=644619 RepID=UPI0031E06CC5